MIWRVARKEISIHVLGLNFLLLLIMCQLLIPISIYIMASGYEKRMMNYISDQRNLANHLRYISNSALLSGMPRRYWLPESNLLDNLWIQRKPEVLSILVEGIDRRIGRFVRVNHKLVPYSASHYALSWEKKIGRHEDIIYRSFQPMDLAVVLQLILSLFSILIFHNAICGEKEAGTLKLLASNGVPRSHIVLGKYIGAISTMLIPFLISFLAGILVLYTVLGIGALGADELLRILLMMVISILYISVFALLGIMISGMTTKSSTSLMISLFIWAILVVVWPNISGFGMRNLFRITGEQIDDQVSKEIDHLKKRYRHDLQSCSSRIVMDEEVRSSLWEDADPDSSGSMAGLEEDVLLNFLGKIRLFYLEAERIGMRYGDETWEIRRKYLERPYRIIRLAWRVFAISPAGAYYELMSILARTDFGSYIRFLDQAKEYRKTLQRWVIDESVSSTRWFTCIFGMADPDRIPRFVQKDEGILKDLARGSGDMILLIAINAILIMGSYIRFLKYDLR